MSSRWRRQRRRPGPFTGASPPRTVSRRPAPDWIAAGIFSGELFFFCVCVPRVFAWLRIIGRGWLCDQFVGLMCK